MASLSAIDRERFGVVTARCFLPARECIAEVARFCDEHRVELLVIRCAASDLAAAHASRSGAGA
jgi:hypothetical protein